MSAELPVDIEFEVPDDVYEAFLRKAANSGMSFQSYMRWWLYTVAARPFPQIGGHSPDASNNQT